MVSTIAMFVLLLFNEKPSYTTAELASILQIDIETLRKNIQSLT